MRLSFFLFDKHFDIVLVCCLLWVRNGEGCHRRNEAGHLLDMLGIAEDARSFEDLADEGWYGALIRTGYRVDLPKPLFPRLELPEADSAEAG